eukprot:scaffold264_cov317-Pinguiococcus_pyrenoidosus.AAC.38
MAPAPRRGPESLLRRRRLCRAAAAGKNRHGAARERLRAAPSVAPGHRTEQGGTLGSGNVGRELGPNGFFHPFPQAAPPAADANAVSAPPGLDAASRVVAAAPGRTMRVASLDDLGPLAEHRLKIFRNIVPTKIPSRTYDTIFENLVASMRRRFFRKGTYILVATRDEDALAPVRRETLMGNLELSCHSLQGFSKANPDDPIDTWYLTEMAVASTFRRLGVATDLLRSSELLAAKKGIRELLLHVEVENTGAVALYEKAGFEILPQTPKVLSFAGQMGLLDPVYAMKRYHLMWKKVDS